MSEKEIIAFKTLVISIQPHSYFIPIGLLHFYFIKQNLFLVGKCSLLLLYFYEMTQLPFHTSFNLQSEHVILHISYHNTLTLIPSLQL